MGPGWGAWAGLVAMVLGSLGPGTAVAAEPTFTTLVLVGTADLHGHLDSGRERIRLEGGEAEVERGGLALLGGYLRILRRHHPGRVLLVDAGDMLQGTLVSNLGEGAATIRAMNALGYHAAAVGNHEFDFGPAGPAAVPRTTEDDPRGALKARARQARFPWLTSNVREVTSGLPVAAPQVRELTIVVLDGIKVGIVGGTSEDTPRTTMAQNLVGLRVEPLAPSVERAAAAARRAGATVVVLAVHAGGECHRFDKPSDLATCDEASEIFALARALPPGTVDAIFAGHTHQGVAAVVNGIPIAQAFSYGSAFARIDLVVDRRSGRPLPGAATVHPPEELCAQVADQVRSCSARRARGQRLVPATYQGEVVTADPSIAAAYAEDRRLAAGRMAEPVGVTLATPVPRHYHDESPLGNLVADALRQAIPGADVGLGNGGGLRADLPAGALRLGALFEALPFDNRVASLRLGGAALRRLFRDNLAGKRGGLAVSGLRVAASCRGGELDVAIQRDDGTPLDDQASYLVATSDFLARGGDDFQGLVGALGSGAVQVGELLLRDAVVASLRRRSAPIRADDPTIFDPARPRVAVPAKRPFVCPVGSPRP